MEWGNPGFELWIGCVLLILGETRGTRLQHKQFLASEPAVAITIIASDDFFELLLQTWFGRRVAFALILRIPFESLGFLSIETTIVIAVEAGEKPGLTLRRFDTIVVG